MHRKLLFFVFSLSAIFLIGTYGADVAFAQAVSPELPENSIYVSLGDAGDPVVRDVREWTDIGDLTTTVNEGVIEATVLEMGNNSWEPKFFVEMPEMTDDTEYTVTFTAYAETPRTIVVKVGQQLTVAPWWLPQFEDADEGVFELTTEPSEYTFSFTFAGTDNPAPYELIWEVGSYLDRAELTTVFVSDVTVSMQGGSPEQEDSVRDQSQFYDDYNPEWELVWAEEFDGSEINPDNWTYDIGTGADGWGNRELQYYTDRPENAFIEDGNLVIEAREEAFEGSDYTSARLKTEGLQSFRYGRIEANIRLPEGQGFWPALWMLGDNFAEEGWPYSGEIDIVELVGGSDDPASSRGDSVVHGTVHWFDEDLSLKADSGQDFVSDDGAFSEDFHVFAIEWNPQYIHWFVDGELYHTVAISQPTRIEFQRSFFLLVNLAVGGNWPGSPDDSSVFPQRMYVDYIRYYQDANLTPPAETVLSDEEKPGDDLYLLAIADDFELFAEGSLVRYGGGNVPEVSAADETVDGEQSLRAVYPGGDWGGMYFELAAIADASAYAGGDLVFSIMLPESISDFELKMESASGSTSLYIVDYTPELVEDGFAQYRIPLADFADVNLAQLRIPFSVWNPMGGGGSGEILLDNIRFEMGN